MERLRARAWSIGNRLGARELAGWPAPVTRAPVTIPGPAGGYVVLFRFGAVAAVGLDETLEKRLLEEARGIAIEPWPKPVAEEAEVFLDPGAEEGVDAKGNLVLRQLDRGRAQVLASILAKSAVLSENEGRLGAVFERIEPFAHALRSARLPRRGQALLQELGAALLGQSRMIGRAEVAEKPEVAWDDPLLDRLYERCAAEYELRDREKDLARKLDLIFKTTRTYLGLLNDRRVLRVEWYIVILIVVEIVLILYELLRIG